MSKKSSVGIPVLTCVLALAPAAVAHAAPISQADVSIAHSANAAESAHCEAASSTSDKTGRAVSPKSQRHATETISSLVAPTHSFDFGRHGRSAMARERILKTR